MPAGQGCIPGRRADIGRIGAGGWRNDASGVVRGGSFCGGDDKTGAPPSASIVLATAAASAPPWARVSRLSADDLFLRFWCRTVTF